MARNIRRRNRPTQSQPGLLDYIGEGWDALLDRGMPFFSENHPASIASRNIDWSEGGDPSKDPYLEEQLDIIANSIGGGSNIPGAIFPGGLLAGAVKRTPIKKGTKVKLKEGESIIAKDPVYEGGSYILTKNPSKGQNYKEGGFRETAEGGGVDMSKAPKKVRDPEGEYRISQIGVIDSDNPFPWGHHAYDSFPKAWKELQKVGEDFQHLSLDNPPLGAPAYLQGSRSLVDQTGLFNLNKGGYPNVPQVRGDLFRPLKPHKEAADIVKILKSSKQQKQLEEWFEAGAKQGGMEWYNTNHLKKFAIEQFGDDIGIQLYERFLRYNAALSPNTAVNQLVSALEI